MSLELSLTAGLAIIIFFFIYMGEKLTKKENFLTKIIGYNSYFTALFFLTILLFLLTEFSVGQTYEGVVRTLFIIFQILFGISAFPGFLITGLLVVLEGYKSIFKKNSLKSKGGFYK